MPIAKQAQFAEIARIVVGQFLSKKRSTPRHELLVACEDPNLLSEMESHTLLSRTPDGDAYLPTSGTFASLPASDPQHLFARSAFIRTVQALRTLFVGAGKEAVYTTRRFENQVARLINDTPPKGEIALGLSLVRDIGALNIRKWSAESTTASEFQIAEQVLLIREPAEWWRHRVENARIAATRIKVPMDYLAAAYNDPDEDTRQCDTHDPRIRVETDQLWNLIHPLIAHAARSRARGRHYADAIENALKAVATEIRRRTGLTLDGAPLMRDAFSTNRPKLIWSDPMPETHRSLQQGYMDIFAGAMTGVRNPKAHGLVHIDERRFIHLLFLTSLLAYKVDEAEDVGSSEGIHARS